MSGIISIRGSQFFILQNETLIDNGDSFNEKLAELEEIMKPDSSSNFMTLLTSSLNMRVSLFFSLSFRVIYH